MPEDIHRNHQKNFRVLLEAVGRPGRAVRLQALEQNTGFAAALAVGQCLLDNEVSLCVAGGGNAGALQIALIEATRARPEEPEKADFIFVTGDESQAQVMRAKRGSLSFPEQGATLVYCLGLDGGAAIACEHLRIRLSGPGIQAPEGISPGLSPIALSTFQTLKMVNADYPLGVDAFFVAPDGELMALPRSTQIRLR